MNKRYLIFALALIMVFSFCMTACGNTVEKSAPVSAPEAPVEEPAQEVEETAEPAPTAEAAAPETVEAAAVPADAAEPKVQVSDTYDVSDIRIMASTNTLRFRENYSSNYQLLDADMNPVSDKPFVYLEDEAGFLLYALEDGVNNIGVLDAQGNEIIPTQYGTIDIRSDKWIVGVVLTEADESNYDYWGIGGSYYLMDHADVYFCGTQVGTLTRDEYDSAEAHGDYLYVDTRSGDPMYFNKEFVKAEPHGDYISDEYQLDYSTDIVWHLGSGTQAFTAGCTLTPEEVDTKVFNKKGVLYDLQGNTVCSTADFSYVNPFIGGYAVTTKSDNKCGIIAEDGTIIADCIYDKINLYGDYVKSGYAQAILDGKLCYIHLSDGNVVQTDFVKDALKDVNAPFATKVRDDGSWQLISAKCGLIPESFSEIGSIYSSCPLVCVGSNGSFGVMDVNGKYIVPCDGTYADKYDLSCSDDGSIVVGETSDGYIVYHITY